MYISVSVSIVIVIVIYVIIVIITIVIGIIIISVIDTAHTGGCCQSGTRRVILSIYVRV